jgi:hypothetical protein
MKKLVSLLSVLVMGVAFSGCDFGSDDNGGDDTIAGQDTVGGEDTAQDVLVAEEGYTYVRIIDDLANVVDVGCQAGNPGADIDAIELMRGGQDAASVVATAGDIVDVSDVPEANATACAANDKDDPSEVLGVADGVAGDGTFTGYFSLNGRTLDVQLWDATDAPVEMTVGDFLHVVEMHNNTPESAENYTIMVGYMGDTDVVWQDLTTEGSTGETFVEIL